MKDQTQDAQRINKNLYEAMISKIEEELIMHYESDDDEEAIISGLDED